jgi:tripartite-type tricarboxylate transporter receptor subunit TctC
MHPRLLTRAMLVCLLLTAALPALVQAQDYPSKAIRLIVPNSPGGATDTAARLVAPLMAERLRQPIVIENRVSAGGVTATNAVAQTAGDGYTLLMVFDSFTTNPWLFPNVHYDPVRDFAPITLVANAVQVFAAHPSLGVKTVDEFLRLARARGSALAVASAGAGTSSRLSFELFRQATGIDPTLVHYKGGSPALNDLLGGQVGAMFVNLGIVLPHLRNGHLVPLGVSSARRTSLLPDSPAIAESLPGFEAVTWMGLLAPASTPRPIVDQLHATLAAVLASPVMREKFAVQGAEVVAGGPEVFAALIRREYARWGKLIRERGITLD